jgi:hypothetical protein
MERYFGRFSSALDLTSWESADIAGTETQLAAVIRSDTAAKAGQANRGFKRAKNGNCCLS